MIKIKKINKFEFLLSKIHNKNVLHVGCCGRVKKLDIKSEINNYLHKFIVDNSNNGYGLDTDKDELQYLKDKGFKNLYFGDAEKISEINFDIKFDVIILGNMFNYFPNPGKFLNDTNSLLSQDGSIIITIENYMTLKTMFKYIFFGRYPDFYHHCFSVNKNTLVTLVNKSGFKVDDYGYIFQGPDNFLIQSFRSKIANKITQLFPNSEKYADGYVIQISKN